MNFAKKLLVNYRVTDVITAWASTIETVAIRVIHASILEKLKLFFVFTNPNL